MNVPSIIYKLTRRLALRILLDSTYCTSQQYAWTVRKWASGCCHSKIFKFLRLFCPVIVQWLVTELGRHARCEWQTTITGIRVSDTVLLAAQLLRPSTTLFQLVALNYSVCITARLCLKFEAIEYTLSSRLNQIIVKHV